jgi:hypothetical protein
LPVVAPLLPVIELAKGHNMDELIKLVSQKTGIAPEQARVAVETVIGHLKARLPAPLAGQIDAALAGGKSDVAGMAKGLGDMLGKKK